MSCGASGEAAGRLVEEKVGVTVGIVTSLLLKMHLGINFFWILGYSSTYLLFHSYELVRVQKSKWQVS